MINNHYKKYICISALLMALSIAFVFVLGLRIAPEFSGTSQFEVSYSEPVTFTGFDVEKTSNGYLLRTKALNDEEYLKAIDTLESLGKGFTIRSYESVSPAISQELVRKSLVALVLASIIIILFISFVFRNVSRPISSWKYGVVAIVALVHDALIPLGVFAFLGIWFNATIDVLFVTAILAVLGYSVNDTIVIFDRIRERLSLNNKNNKTEAFEDTVDFGTLQSVRRSVYTSLSTALPLITLFILVPVTRFFGVALFVGVLAGTFSSLFFAPSMLVAWNRLFREENIEKDKSDTEKAEEELFSRLREKKVANID